MSNMAPILDNASYLNKSLSEFKILDLKFILTPHDKIIFGRDEKKGDMWRGAFGEALRNKACFYRWDSADCFSCDKSVNCFYFAYFGSDKPHPFVISPELDSKKVFIPGEELILNILLIGEAIEHYDKFIKVIEEAGKIGIGIKRGRFNIEKIEAEPPKNFNDIFTADEQINDELIIKLITPIKLKDKQNGIYFDQISFA